MSKGLLIGLVAGGVLLLILCGGGIVGGLVWFSRAKDGPKDALAAVGQQTNQAAIVGEWRLGKVERWEFRADGKLKKDTYAPLVPAHNDLVYTFSAPNVVEITGDAAGNNRNYAGKPYRERWEIVRLGGKKLEYRQL